VSAEPQAPSVEHGSEADARAEMLEPLSMSPEVEALLSWIGC